MHISDSQCYRGWIKHKLPYYTYKTLGIPKIHMNATLGKSHFGANLVIFIQKNVGILKIHIHATLGKSHLDSNIAIFIQKTLASKGFTWMPFVYKTGCASSWSWSYWHCLRLGREMSIGVFSVDCSEDFGWKIHQVPAVWMKRNIFNLKCS